MNIREKNAAVVLKIITALESRDPQRPDPQSVADLFQPDVEFYWPISLPYGGASQGVKTDASTWLGTWSPLQPTEIERKMDPRVVAASDEEVVVLGGREKSVRAGIDSRARCWVFIKSAIRSLHAPRCFTSTPQRWSISWPRRKRKRQSQRNDASAA